MTDPGKKAVSGGCYCGAVRFALALPTTFCVHCHCSMCRRLHGAAYVTWVAVPRAQLTLLAGERELQRHASSAHGSRAFCRRCGTSLFCELTTHPDQVDVPLANLEGPIDRAPQMHVFFSDRAAWVAVEDGLPRLGGPTGVEPIERSED